MASKTIRTEALVEKATESVRDHGTLAGIALANGWTDAARSHMESMETLFLLFVDLRLQSEAFALKRLYREKRDAAYQSECEFLRRTGREPVAAWLN